MGLSWLSGTVTFRSGGLSYVRVVGLSVVVVFGFSLCGGTAVTNGVGDDKGRGEVRALVGPARTRRGVVGDTNMGVVVGAAVVVVVVVVVLVERSSAVNSYSFMKIRV